MAYVENADRLRKQQDAYNKKNVKYAREVANQGVYRKQVPGLTAPGGYSIQSGLIDQYKKIPYQGPYSSSGSQIQNLYYAAEKATSDQERNMLFEAARQLENRLQVAQEQEATYTQIAKNQEAASKLPADQFFGTNVDYQDPIATPDGGQVPMAVKEKEAKVETPKVESQFELKGGPLKSEAQAREDWLEKTRNSPAQQSGAFTGQELWEQSKKSGANKGREFAEAIKKPEVKSEGLLNKMKKR